MKNQLYRIGGNTQIDFREGVFVQVPGRPDVKVVRKGFGSPIAAGFDVIRPLVNFFIEDAAGTPVQNFNPRLELIVRFTQNDLDIAGNQQLVFGYYDLVAGAWVLHPPAPPYVIRHIFPEGLEGFDGYRGYDAIRLDHWPPDPGSAWGV